MASGCSKKSVQASGRAPQTSGDSWSRRLNSSHRVAFQVPSSRPVHSSHDSRWKPWQSERESRAGIPQLSPKPLPPVVLSLSLWLSCPHKTPRPRLTVAPPNSIKAISVEVTRACRLALRNLHTDPHLNFCLRRPWSWGARWQPGLTCPTRVLQCPLSCWHYTPSLWPWSPWTLSRSVSMTPARVASLLCCWICMYRVGVA